MRRAAITLALGLAAVTLAAALKAGPAEEAVLMLWSRQAEMEPAEAAVLCARALDSGTLGSYAPVARTLMGLNLLKAGRPQDAAAAYASALSSGGDPLSRAADNQARRWLTRIDREALVAALRQWYAANVAYPPALDVLQTLPDIQTLPLQDRWGDPWNYRLVPMRQMPQLTDQRYQLESRALFRSSDLATALRQLESSTTHVRFLRIVSRQPPVISVEITQPEMDPVNATLALGASASGVRLCALSPIMAICSDGDRWIMVPFRSDPAGERP